MEEPLLILSATPLENTRLNHFFEKNDNGVFHLLKEPPAIRHMGWDLATLDEPQIIKGECWAVANGDRKYIRVYEDGTVVFRGSADSSFLGWGQDPDKFLQNPRLNPIAVIELILNYVQFVQKLGLYYIKKPKNITFQIDLKNAWFENRKLLLGPHGVESTAYQFNFNLYKKAAPEKMFSKEKQITYDDLDTRSEYVCFELVKEIYLWFGISLDGIPYASQDASGNRFIDKSKIVNRR